MKPWSCNCSAILHSQMMAETRAKHIRPASGLLLTAFVLYSASVLAVPYVITDLGTLGGAHSLAFGINDSGQVVGAAYLESGYSHPFLYSNGTMSDLGTLDGGTNGVAFSINNSGQVAGSAYTADGDIRAFLYSNGSMNNLGTLGGNRSQAFGINDSGQVVGWADTTSAVRAFLYSNGSMINLGSLSDRASQASAINDNGEIAGWYIDNTGTSVHAFVYSDGSMIDIGTLGSSPSSAAFDINNSGQVVGRVHSTTGIDPDGRAFLYTNGLMIDLGTLGGTSSWAYGINDSGQVVGWANTADGEAHAFLYGGDSMTDLSQLPEVLAAGWTSLDEARGINDKGQIVGYGHIGGNTHAFLLSPIPEPATLSLVGLGLLGMAAWRRPRSV